MLRFRILTLFPESFVGFLASSLMGKAQSKGLVDVKCVQIRDFATDKHRTVDDTQFGGGEGMVLRADVLHAAWTATRQELARLGVTEPKTVYLSPQGKVWNQQSAKSWGSDSAWILVCGHYEGVDQRFIDLCVDEEVSIGDYVLTGGELPAAILLETVTRLVPGVLGNQNSLSNDSFENGRLKHPVYTKPRSFESLDVPEILLSGDHGAIEKWRNEQSLGVTKKKRPDLK